MKRCPSHRVQHRHLTLRKGCHAQGSLVSIAVYISPMIQIGDPCQAVHTGENTSWCLNCVLTQNIIENSNISLTVWKYIIFEHK